jgi:hypothetical protein
MMVQLTPCLANAADQAPSQSKPLADEGPSSQIFQPAMHAGWDAVA